MEKYTPPKEHTAEMFNLRQIAFPPQPMLCVWEDDDGSLFHFPADAVGVADHTTITYRHGREYVRDESLGVVVGLTVDCDGHWDIANNTKNFYGLVPEDRIDQVLKQHREFREKHTNLPNVEDHGNA